LLLLLSAAPALAQSSGALLGLITAPNGYGIRNAHVVLVDLRDGKRRETTTDENGIYAFSLLPAGAYRIEGVKAGFPPLRVEPVVLDVDEKRSLRLEWNHSRS
jgi:hypothetical protein